MYWKISDDMTNTDSTKIKRAPVSSLGRHKLVSDVFEAIRFAMTISALSLWIARKRSAGVAFDPESLQHTTNIP
jgi:hypothetical protein